MCAKLWICLGIDILYINEIFTTIDDKGGDDIVVDLLRWPISEPFLQPPLLFL